MNADTIKNALLDWSKSKTLSQAKFSEDSQLLTLGDVTLPAKEKISFEQDGKTVEYSVASVYILITDPSQGAIAYRNSCKQHNVDDAVKTLDKAVVTGFFLGAEATSSNEVAKPSESTASTSDKRKEDRHKRKPDSKSSSSRDKKRHSSGSHKHHSSKEKKVAKTVTTDEVLANLSEVAAKRNEMNINTHEDITKALSTDGFDVTPELLQEHRELAETIMGREIPVGDSSSILLAENPHRDLSRVLSIFEETLKKADKAGNVRKPPTDKRHYLIGKKPVIIVPKGMTAPLTIVNAHEFLANARFVPRDLVVKQNKHRNPPTTFTRTFRDGRLVEYEIMDNPRKLGDLRNDWERIVAVVALGQSWQFKGWKSGYEKPVDLFARSFGFFVSMEGDKIPPEVSGWRVQQSRLNRDKRGLDSVTYASFWNGLDEWMLIHRPELLQVVPREA